jgi:hemerythrin
MRTLTWKSDFLIGIDAIDSEHREIFDRLLALEQGMLKRDPWHVMQFLLADVAHALKFHFAVEEALLEMIGFPEREEHRQQHMRLTLELSELEKKIRKSNSATDLVHFFEEWFVKHVLAEDRQFIDFAQKALTQFSNASRPTSLAAAVIRP